MVKYVYSVVNPFIITEDEETGEREILEPSNKNIKGTHFTKKMKYVDYNIPSEDLEPDPLTQDLIDQGYLELDNQKDIDLSEQK